MSTSRQIQNGKRLARKKGLRYVNDFTRGWTRQRRGAGFTYLSTRGKTITSARTRQRIQSLAIPPAWNDVWICPQPNGHIQAVGRDEAGRRQYIYDPRWQLIREANLFASMSRMAELLPRIRRRLRKDLDEKQLTRNRVLAAVVRVLDRAHVRIGNAKAVQQTGARGATTLTRDHVEIDRFTISLEFPGKSGQRRAVEFSDRKVVRVVRQCEQIDGQFLFSYLDADGEVHAIDSTSVNNYLREITNESITAKDFRTWWGSVTALSHLTDEESESRLTLAERKRRIREAIAETAVALGNTKAVCRKSYIHPGILSRFESGELHSLREKASKSAATRPNELTVAEHQFAILLPYLDAK